MKMRCYPRLVVLKKEGTTGSIYPFPMGRCSVGGLSSCDIRIPSFGNGHCLVVVDKNHQAHIVNVDGSAVEVNGVHVENEAFVNHNDLIKIGSKSLRFEWFTKPKQGTSNAGQVPTDGDRPQGAMRESSTSENGAGDCHADQESHGSPGSNGAREPHGTPTASASGSSFLDQSVYKTPHIPPEEFVSPLTAPGSNDTSRQSQGASSLKGSLKQGSGQPANPAKRLSWSNTPHRSDQGPSKNLSRSRGRLSNASLSVTPSKGVHAEDDVQAGVSNGRPSDSVPSTTSTPLIDEPRMRRAMHWQGSFANGDSTPLTVSLSTNSDSDTSMLGASSSSQSGAKEQHARRSVPMTSVRGRSLVSHNNHSSSGEDSFDQAQGAATPSTGKGIFAASTPVVPSPLAAGRVSSGAKLRSRSVLLQTKPNTTVSEAPDSSQSFFDTSTGSSGVLSFAGEHSSYATPLRTPRPNVPRKASNVSGGSVGQRLLHKSPKQSFGSGNMNEVDSNELLDASGSSRDRKVASQNRAQNGQAIESKVVPGSLEQNIGISGASTPRVQRKGKETRLAMKSSPDCREQAEKGPRASRTPSVKGREVETPAKKGHKEEESVEHKTMSPKEGRSSRAGSSKKSSGGLEELESPSASSRISRAHALTEANGSKEATHQDMAQKSLRRTRSGSFPGPSTAVEEGHSSLQEADSPEVFSCSPVVELEKLVLPARMTRASCTPLSGKVNKDMEAKGDRKSLTGAAAAKAKKSGTSSGVGEASSGNRSASSTELSHDADDSVTSKKNARTSSGRASTNVKKAEATEPEVAQKSFRGRSSSTGASKRHDEAETAEQEVTRVSSKTSKTDCKEKPSDSPVAIARSSRGSRTSASVQDKAEAEETDIVKRSRGSVAGAKASNRPEKDQAHEQEITTALEKPSSSAAARSSRGSRTPASTSYGTEEKGTDVKNPRESSAGRRASSRHTLEDGDNSVQNNSVGLPASTPKDKNQQSFDGPSDSPVVARSSRGSRASASDEDKAEVAEKDTAFKKSRGTSVGARSSNRPEEAKAQEQGNTAGVEMPSISPVNAKSSRGSRTPASKGQDTVVKRSRASTAGPSTALKSMPEDDGQEDTTTVPARTPKAGHPPSTVVELVTPSRGTRANHTPASRETRRQTLQQEISPRGSRRSQAGCTDALNVTEENETSECVSMSETPKAGNQQIENEKNGAASSTKKGSQSAHLNVTGSSTAESPKVLPRNRGRRSANTPASKDALDEDETSQHDFVDMAPKTPQVPKNKSVKDASMSTAQSPKTEQPTRSSRRILASVNMSEDSDLQNTVNISQSFKAEQPTGGSRASRRSGSKEEIEKHALHSDASTAQSPETEQESKKGSPGKARTSKGGRTPVLKKRSVEKSVATPTSSEVQGETSHISEPSPRVTRFSSTPVLKRASQGSGTPRSKKKEACIVGKDQELEQSDANPEQPDDSVSKRRHPRPKKSVDTDLGHLDDAERTGTETSAKKSQKVVATVAFENEQIENELATPEAAQSLIQSRAKRATASKMQAGTPDKMQQDEAAAAHEMNTPRKTRGKRALVSQLEASENQRSTEENTADVPAKRKRGGRTPASTLDLNDDQEGLSTGTSKVTRTAASESDLKAEKGTSGTPVKKRRGRLAAASSSGDQDGTVEDLPLGKTRRKRVAASESELNTEESMVGAPERKNRRGRAAASSVPKADRSDGAEDSALGQTKTAQASGSELNSAEDTTDVPAKRKRGGRVAALTSGLKADQDHVAEGEAAKAAGTELNSAEDTADVPAKRKRAGRAAASRSIPKADQEADMAESSLTVKTTQALGSELNPAEGTADLPAKRKRGGRVAASSNPKVDQSDMGESSSTGKTAQASGCGLNSVQDTADVPAKRKRGARVAASISVDEQDDKTAAGTSCSAEAKSSSRATRTASARQKTTDKAESGQAAPAGADGEEAATSLTLGRSRRRGAVAAAESPPPTVPTPKKTRGRRAKALDTIADEEETGEPAAGTSAATEPRASKRATRRKV